MEITCNWYYNTHDLLFISTEKYLKKNYVGNKIHRADYLILDISRILLSVFIDVFIILYILFYLFDAWECETVVCFGYYSHLYSFVDVIYFLSSHFSWENNIILYV